MHRWLIISSPFRVFPLSEMCKSLLYAPLGQYIELLHFVLLKEVKMKSVRECMRLRATLEACEKKRIRQVLGWYDWNKPLTAKLLGVGLSTLYRKINKHKIKQ